MPQMIRGFKFEQTLKEFVREFDTISEKKLVELTGVTAHTLYMYLQRPEFTHVKKLIRPKRYIGITETDITRLKVLTTRRFNRG